MESHYSCSRYGKGMIVARRRTRVGAIQTQTHFRFRLNRSPFIVLLCPQPPLYHYHSSSHILTMSLDARTNEIIQSSNYRPLDIIGEGTS